ncbi:hypothetical protein GCM10022261_27910 [Brevibacterium daeguense]|uniref:Uncharacterized protein n=1 Tax=Brevibacterium daeguense TaxID=909936 RepID=A0ABP8EMQ6_9MICO|nr:hypothetical protein [Brevibacterium daeguense]
MIQRLALVAAGIAAAAVLTACTAPEPQDSEESPQSPAASAPETTGGEDEGAGDEQPDVQTTQGELLPGFPEVIEQFPDSEIVSSSMGSGTAGAAQEPADGEEAEQQEGDDPDQPVSDQDEGDQPAPGEDQVSAALVMRTGANEQEILDFYTESLEGHGFAAVGEADNRDGVTTQAFHAEEDNQTVSVSIGPDPEDESARLITVGGVVNR